ncbi:chromosome replication/partitioning protein [Borreliella valaisiana]|uniref:Putative plasmid partition protein n=2 Tax=Borreliella TaxID=64895 RepID=C0R992_BORVA|nr:chromosome replication/partitioning protein [Borreliella valaisiana]ACN52960.1 putative plasmid partition protein [Borreliella valaisiana VS116]WLN25733.1 chromosome replication/partitioning protein [Borreliella valaisiana]
MEKKENKNQVTLYKRIEIPTGKELDLDNNQDEELKNYNKLKEQLKLNLKSDINNKIQRMKILYEIKQKELYKYDGFKSFKQFIKSYIIARSQAYMYLKIYEKVLEGAISIEKVKEIGFVATYKNILKNNSLYVYKEKMIEENVGKYDDSQNISIRILIKDKEVYDFCKKDTKRIYFILERLIKDKKNILSSLIIDYENHRKNKKKKVSS